MSISSLGCALVSADGGHSACVAGRPCGRCLGCRVSSSSSLALRARVELLRCDGEACVVTRFCPGRASDAGAALERDSQAYLKRLRHFLAPALVRFVSVFSYEAAASRWRVDDVIFGFWPADAIACGEVFRSEFLEHCWGNGDVFVRPVGPAVLDEALSAVRLDYFGVVRSLVPGDAGLRGSASKGFGLDVVSVCDVARDLVLPGRGAGFAAADDAAVCEFLDLQGREALLSSFGSRPLRGSVWRERPEVRARRARERFSARRVALSSGRGARRGAA